MNNTATRTATLPTTLNVAMLVRDSSNETLREANRYEIEDAAACVARRGFSLTTILTTSDEIPCRVEYVTRAISDAEHNALLVEIGE